MLKINTFDAARGGNVLYKALAHPLAAEAIARLYATLRRRGTVAVFDTDGIAEALLAMHPDTPEIAGVYVQDVTRIGADCAGHAALPVAELGGTRAQSVLVAAFDAERILVRLRHLIPAGVEVFTLDAARLPEKLLSNPRKILDPLNYATNYAFFRDQGGLSTRVVSANYWANYGAKSVTLWLRLFGEDGRVLAEWDQKLPVGAGGYQIDSREVRHRFRLPEFTGQLFIHAVGAVGHDVVKYALDTYASDGGESLSATHDANAWPSERYAGLPAPRADERVILWVQNSHAAEIPVGGIALDRMGAETPVVLPRAVPPYATVALDVAELLPGLHWPAQIELRAGRHVVRPRYEVTRGKRTRIAHVNVERGDLKSDPGIAHLHPLLGRGFLLPFPVLPRDQFRTIVQPTPMAEAQGTIPCRIDLFGRDGRKQDEIFLGCLGRDHDVAVEIASLAEGHGELVYDFREGGEADGWLHALVRYEHLGTGHEAETSFGAHIFNTVMTWKGEPQSYNGPPPGLSTRLFLRLGGDGRRSFTCLTYPASAAWHATSRTVLMLHDGGGHMIAEHGVEIACSGSVMLWPDELFSGALMRQAGQGGYVIVRDTTCRLFGYAGLMDAAGRFSLDHMFGF